ncbi:MAG: VCBS repeat-containing protein, partial [Planctomycetota bacterium]
LPQQLILLLGFAGQTHFSDVDGDGRPDLVVATLRPDLIDILGSKGKEKIEIELLVYLNRKGTFSKQPDFRRTLKIKVAGFKNISTRKLARFFGDLTKDGTAELLVQDRPEKLNVFLTKKNRDGTIQVFDRPLATFEMHEKAHVISSSPNDAGKPYIVALEGNLIRYLRLSR